MPKPFIQQLFCWLLLALCCCCLGSTRVWAQAPTTAPSLNVPTLGNNQVSLSWNAVANATSYKVYRSTSSGTLGSSVHTPTGTSQNATGLTNGSTYYFTIRAANSSGEGPSSNQRAATPMATPVLSLLAGHQSVWMTWPSVAGASSYSLYRGTSSTGLTLLAGSLSSSTLSYSDSGLTAGTTYYYYLVANNATGTTTSSTVNATVMSAPQVVVTVSNTQITLDWPVSPGATAYEIRRGLTYATATVLVASTTSRTYTNTGLTTGSGYTYYVVAKNSSGYTYSTVNTIATTPPVLTSVLGSAQVTLNWTAATGVTQYYVYRGTNPNDFNSFSAVGGPLSSSTLTFTNTGLTNGTTYYYAIVGTDGTGNINSNLLEAKPMALPVAYPFAGGGQAVLNWSAVTGATGYSIYRGDTSTTLSLVTSSLGASATTYTDTGLTPGNTYYYRLVANNATGSTNSSVVNVTVMTYPQVIPTPANTQITLNWAAVPGATQYEVRKGADFNSATVLSTSVPTRTYTDTGLTAGNTYTYYVVARNAGGFAYTVVPVMATTPPVLTFVPGNSQVTLNWTSATGVTQYYVYRGTDPNDFNTFAPVGGALSSSTLTYTDTGLINGDTYYYAILGTSSTGYVNSNAVEVTLSSSQVPSAVTYLTAIAGDKQIALSWKASPIATGYKLLRSTTMGDFTGSPTVLVSDAYYHDPNVLNGTTYYYAVYASNSYGDSPAAYTSAQPFAEAGNATPNRPTVLWGIGNPITCAGIRWPFVGATISPSSEGQLSAFLATDFDQRETTVASVQTSDVYSDPCTYTWSVSGGSFKNGVNTGQGAIWIAPSTPGTYTITLVVDDQHEANQPTYEPGDRTGNPNNHLTINDNPLTFTRTVTVAP